MAAAPRNSLEKNLLRKNLQFVSVYLILYQLLDHLIVKAVRDSFILEQDYRTKVLRGDPDIFHASCRWLHETGAIRDDQLEDILLVHAHRDVVSSDLIGFLVARGCSVDASLLERLRSHIACLGRFWSNFAHETSSEYRGFGEVTSGVTLFADYLVSIARLPTDEASGGSGLCQN